jgi:nitrite reductase/ring-hydroxylating ferredoxin subunit
MAVRAPLRHRLLLRAYPAAWRRRYGDELLALLAERDLAARDVLDVLAGALDARLHPGLGRSALRRVAAIPVPQPGTRSAAAFGIVAATPPAGVLSRRTFMRRMLGVGATLLSLEFMAGTLSFLWPNIREGLGAQFRVGRMPEILAAQPSFALGRPFPYNPARAFLVNVPAAMAWAEGREASVPDPSADELLALWRKCPHLGCLVPEPCESLSRITCRCHGSTYNVLGEKLKEGPAERGLDRFAVRIEDDGTVVIDTSEVIRGAPNLGPARLTFADPHPWEATCP